MTGVAVELRTVQQPGVAFPIVDDGRRVCLDRIDATQISIMMMIWFSMNFIVVITLLMR